MSKPISNSNDHVVLTTQMNIDKARIVDLLDCALEDGSTYWIGSINSFTSLMKVLSPDGYAVFTVDDDGDGDVCYSDDEHPDGKFILNLAAIHKGLSLLATQYPSSWSDFMNENEDAETGDIFLQLCLFGKLVFG